jgi:hypothetical protein
MKPLDINKHVIEKINIVNNLLTENLKRETKGKKTVFALSGGHDTRTNLSILLKNKIEFTAYTYKYSIGDIPLASKLSREFGFPHILNMTYDKKLYDEVYTDCDIFISGNVFTETMNKMHMLNRSETMINDYIDDKYERHDNTGYSDKSYSPALEPRVKEAIRDIPLCYLIGSNVQKVIIALNEPRLLDTPFTYYDWRHQLLNIFGLSISNIIFGSYYRGRSRNKWHSVDKKHNRNVWWKTDEATLKED